MRTALGALALALALAGRCAAEDEAAPGSPHGARADGPPLATLVVTATRTPEPVDRIPADISVVSGKDLSLRDSQDMASALSLVPGVEAPAGGDAGPSSAVPAFWGLHEFDAFLLVVDGVPWGGAFNPMITTLDMNDVERIEVLKGAAPVMYGATSFVGVVQAIHYPAGQAANEIDLAGGEYGSARGSASLVLPQVGGYRQSLAIDGRSLSFADRRENVSDGHLLYRGALDAGAGVFTVDADLTIVRDTPPSPVIRVGPTLTTLTPLDANFNPADAKIDQDEYHLSLGYSRPTVLGQWDTLISVAHSDIRDVRAFLHPDLGGAADSQDQFRHIDDEYVDTHLSSRIARSVSLVVGADLLYGLGKQTTLNGNSGYIVPLDGSALPPPTSQIVVNEIGKVDDQRVFVGQYAQLDWRPGDRWDIVGGLRLNETYEHKISSDFTTPPPVLASQAAHRADVRPTETIGVSYQLWRRGADELIAYVDWRDAFKPSALDFGPDYQPAVLLPETAQSWEAGLKGALDEGRLAIGAELFELDFHNLVVATPSGFLANAAGERLRGVELESRWQVKPNLALAANFAYHDARFTRYLFADPSGVSVEVGGNQLPLSPRALASGGILYTPPHGLNGSVLVSYVGRRYLDEENTAPVGAYATLAATVGYRFGRYSVAVEGTNLTNERPAVTSSEFGSESFYRLNPRMVWLRVGYRL